MLWGLIRIGIIWPRKLGSVLVLQIIDWVMVMKILLPTDIIISVRSRVITKHWAWDIMRREEAIIFHMSTEMKMKQFLIIGNVQILLPLFLAEDRCINKTDL